MNCFSLAEETVLCGKSMLAEYDNSAHGLLYSESLSQHYHSGIPQLVSIRLALQNFFQINEKHRK